jgi:hypothetical protein
VARHKKKKMKSLLTIFAFFAITSCFAQYSKWQLEDIDSLKRQFNEAWEAWDYNRSDGHFNPHMMARYEELGYWCGYKIECYMDSIVTEYDVHRLDGQEIYLTPKPRNAYYSINSFLRKELVTKRRTPNFTDFMQYRLSRKNNSLIFTPHAKIPAKD